MRRYSEQILFVAFLFLLIIAIYVSLSRYLFGSSSPCGILEARMRPYRIQLERDAAFEIERKHSLEGEATQFTNPQIRRLIAEDWKRIEAAPETATKKLREEISQLNGLQCAWRAMTWEPPAPRSGG
jgi:hypothetical protein